MHRLCKIDADIHRRFPDKGLVLSPCLDTVKTLKQIAYYRVSPEG
jgi:hypothetical protein